MLKEVLYPNILASIPMPEIGSVSGWKEVPIRHPNNERLIDINAFAEKEGILVEPMYWLQGIDGAIPHQRLRETAAVALVKAARLLMPSYRLKVWDAHRSLETQQGLFDSFWKVISRTNPSLSRQQLLDLTQTYVSLPSERSDRPSPHFTGGSVDLTLVDRTGNELWAGTAFDYFGPEASTMYFEHPENIVDPKDLTAQRNRRILFHTMSAAGWSNYLEEWWHFDMGNQFNAKVTGRQAVYGPMSA